MHMKTEAYEQHIVILLLYVWLFELPGVPSLLSLSTTGLYLTREM